MGGMGGNGQEWAGMEPPVIRLLHDSSDDSTIR